MDSNPKLVVGDFGARSKCRSKESFHTGGTFYRLLVSQWNKTKIYCTPDPPCDCCNDIETSEPLLESSGWVRIGLTTLTTPRMNHSDGFRRSLRDRLVVGAKKQHSLMREIHSTAMITWPFAPRVGDSWERQVGGTERWENTPPSYLSHSPCHNFMSEDCRRIRCV